MRVVYFATIILSLSGSVHAQGVPDKMGGTGYAKQGGKTCSSYAAICVRNNPGASDKCQSAQAACMQTGTFKGPQGKSYSGLAKN
jgi:hypothetical protein